MSQVKEDIQDKVEKLEIVAMEADHQTNTVETTNNDNDLFTDMNRSMTFSQNGEPIYAETRRLCIFYPTNQRIPLYF